MRSGSVLDREETIMEMPKALVSQQGLSSLQRPRFEPGLLLEDEDLTAGVDYTRDMVRLMFRSLFGCGVICGLKVEGRLICNNSQLEITIGKGLALDCMGDLIQIPKAQTLRYDPECEPLPPKIWVAVCYIEKCCRPRDISCSPDDDSHVVHTRTHGGFEIRLYSQMPECACSCEKPLAETQDICACYEAHMDGECACECGCTCVVIGVVDTKMPEDSREAEGNLPVDWNMVRRIRPILTGYLECLKQKVREDLANNPPKPVPPATPTPPPPDPPRVG